MAQVARGSLINQILLPNLPAFLQFIHPVLRDAARVLAGHQSVVRTLIHEQSLHLLDLEITGVKFAESGGQFDTQFRRVETVAVGDSDVHSLARLPAIVARCGREGDGYEAYSRDAPGIE